MKWYLHRHHKLHLKDIKVKRGESLELYFPWVIQIANTFARDSVAIGALNLQDLIQAGYTGLVDAWNNLEHDKEQAEKWSYIKKRIKWAIRRDIDKHGSFIAQPINKQEKLRNNLSVADKILVNTFAKFFDKSMIIEAEEYNESYANEQLGELLDNYLYSNFKNTDHVEILRSSFGIDRDKPVSMKELSIKYRISVSYLQNLKHKMIKDLKQDEQFKIIIKNFYDN